MPSVLDLFSLQGQTALVTGGTRGIGAAMAIALAEAGADIILVQRTTGNTTTQNTIRSLSRRCPIYTADLSSKESVKELVPKILADGHRIHILVNAAGIQRRNKAEMFTGEDWDEVLQVNLSSVFTLCREVGAHMLEQSPLSISPSGSDSTSTSAPAPSARRGTIINLASLLSFSGGITVPAYAASKGGITQLTKALSNEWAGRGVTVNAIAPGYVATEMNSALMADKGRARGILERIPMGRWGRAEDFGGVVVWLAGRAAGYVSGECVTVDGGWMGR